MKYQNNSNSDLIKELLNKSTPLLSTEVRRKIQKPNEITPLEFNDKNKLLTDTNLQEEIGYMKLASGGWLIAMVNELPEITEKMIDWWFWWYPQDSKRFELWYPKEHYEIDIKESDAYGEKYSCFKPCTHYPIERIGENTVKLTMNFKNPESYGFNTKLFKENQIAKVICANLGIFKGIVGQSKMTNIFKETDNGLKLITRYWIGENSTSIVQNNIFNEEQIYALAKHHYIEYKRLSEILPSLYKEYLNEVVRIKIE